MSGSPEGLSLIVIALILSIVYFVLYLKIFRVFFLPGGVFSLWLSCFLLGIVTQVVIINLLKSLAAAVLSAVSFLISLLFYIVLALSIVVFLYLAIKTWKDSKSPDKNEAAGENVPIGEDGPAGENEVVGKTVLGQGQFGQLKEILYRKKFTVMGLCFVIFSLCLLSIPGLGIVVALIGTGISAMEKDEEDSKWSSIATVINFILAILAVIWTISSIVSFFNGKKEEDALPVFNPNVHIEATSDTQENLKFDIESFQASLYAEQEEDYEIEESRAYEPETLMTEETVGWQQEIETTEIIPESTQTMDDTESLGTTEMESTGTDASESVEEKVANYQIPSERLKRTWTYNTRALNNTVTITDITEDSITFDIEAVWTQIGKSLELKGITAAQDVSEPTRFNFDVDQASGYIDIRSGSPHVYILYDTGFAYIDINGGFS